MQRIVGIVVIVLLECALIVPFTMFTASPAMSAAQSAAQNFNEATVTAIIGILGMVYLKIIWKLVNKG